jgi:hypothetical protein
LRDKSKDRDNGGKRIGWDSERQYVRNGLAGLGVDNFSSGPEVSHAVSATSSYEGRLYRSESGG